MDLIKAMGGRRQATGKKEGEKGRRSDGETKRLARPAKPAGPQDNHTTNPVVNKSIY